jgi:hypothetical protein
MEIPTAPYLGIESARLSGTLTYQGQCLLFRSDANQVQLIPVWPDGTRFNGTSVIFHQPGRMDQPLLMNEEFLMSGKPVQWAGIPGPRTPVHQRQCGGTPFVVASIRPAN